MKLEIRLESDDTYSVVDTYFHPSMCDPSGLYPKNKPLVLRLTKDNAQAILKIAETRRNEGYQQGIDNAIAHIDLVARKEQKEF